ncbi:MAG: type III pantothenate kinase [Bacteroidia bacterium]
MNLIIDIGNTRVKAALFEQGGLVQQWAYFYTTEELPVVADFIVKDILKSFEIKQAIVASVVEPLDGFLIKIKEYVPTLLFSSTTPIPIKNNYQTATTLGSDRLAAAIGGNRLYRNKNLLVIDAGTCIKYNFVSEKNEYLGGAISPGLKMRFKALNQFTSRLPLIEAQETFTTLIGQTTQQSILSGVQNGACAEIDAFIEQYNQLFQHLEVILTGGDAFFFEKRLKKPIFTDSFLILKGLNTILEYNLSFK